MMEFICTYYDEIISGLTLIFGLIGGFFALWKWNKSLKLNRAEYVKKLLDEIWTNKRINFYLFEYNEKWYDKNFHGSDKEKEVDITLEFYSYICYLKENGIIKDYDFDCFKYDIERILMNEQFRDYCYNLYHYSDRIRLPMSFYYLFKYAKDNNTFDDDFEDISSDKYHHYLNF